MADTPRTNLLVSYPKSGRTWVRFMLHTYVRLLSGKPAKHFMDDERELFDPYGIEVCHIGGELRDPYYALGLHRLDTLNLGHSVLLVRNVYETLNSAFYEVVFRQPQLGCDENRTAFLRDPRFGATKLATFFNVWASEVAPRSRTTTRLTYDDFKFDTTRSFVEVLRAYEIPIDDTLVKQAVDSGTFENMRAVSLDENCTNPKLQPRDRNDQRTFKIRSGDSGEALGSFSEADLEYIGATMKIVLTPEARDWVEPCLGRPGEVNERVSMAL